MNYTSESDNFTTPIKSQNTSKTMSQITIMSSSDLLGSQLISKSAKTILHTHKHKAIASPEPAKSQLPENQNPDKMLEQVRYLLKQTLQQTNNHVVQLELQNSITALNQACKHANLVSLEQSTENFYSQNQQIQENVQKQLNSFKSDISDKLNEIMNAIAKQPTAQTTSFSVSVSFTAFSTRQNNQKAKTLSFAPSTELFALKPLHTVEKTTKKTPKFTSNVQTVSEKTSNMLKSTYADVVSNNKNVKPNTWTTIQKKPKSEKPKPISYHERHLILTPKTKVNIINSILLHNKVNSALKTAKIDNLLVSTVALSQSGASLVFTTCEGTAEDLLKHEKI